MPIDSNTLYTMLRQRETCVNQKGHAVALFSGGLDSSLAILLVLRQNIRVTALSFMTHFGCDPADRSSCSRDPYPVAEKFGFEVKMVHLGHDFVQIVKNPKHGHGRNMNPCIDCRILMLREAKKFMEIVGADFIITGEVVGQRPMSQHKPTLRLIAREAGLNGRLLRPLSAKMAGLVDRKQLEAISGRSRRRQMELARELGLEAYPSPAAGCLLTDVGYSNRLRDLLKHIEEVDFNDLNLLRVGRHFRLDPDTKVIVGRNKVENDKIVGYRRPQEWLFEAQGGGSPLTLLVGNPSEENIRLAASITARYCDLKKESEVEIIFGPGPDINRTMTVSPASDLWLETIRL